MSAGEGRPVPAVALRRPCPICGRAAAPEFSPFCSRRCADVDLHRWLGEGYRLPAGDEEAPDDAAGPE